MIASRRLSYGGHQLDPGDEFVANDRDAKTLTIIGSARYATRALTAQTGGPNTLRLPKRKKQLAAS
jgi:hypothetical protein